MHPFDYVRPDTLSDVIELRLAGGDNARILAGGTDLMPRMRAGDFRPDVVVDVKRVQELRPQIIERDGVLRISATAVMADLVKHYAVQTLFPALAEAANQVGSWQIRNRATLVGNVCNASPVADTVPALLIYDASVEAASRSGARMIRLADFFTGPGRTVLRPDEIVTAVEIPGPARRTSAAFTKLGRRVGVDLAAVNVCCGVDPDGVTRLAYGSVGPTALTAEDRTGRLVDPAVSAPERDAILAELASVATPISDVRAGREYRQAMLLVLSRRALDTALRRRPV